MAKGLMMGFLAGGIVGAVVALLYAPKAGRELRNDIRVLMYYINKTWSVCFLFWYI